MAASYPASAKSFSAFNDGDTIQDEHIEEAYDEITALEQALLSSGLAHDLFPDATANTRDLGTSSKLWDLLYINTGIKFPGTQVPSADANTLDDYEEGNWTPVLGGGGGTSGQTYTTQLGRYVKVGKHVFCSFFIELSAKGTITGSLQLQGLPFTIATGSGFRFSAAVNWEALASSAIGVWLEGQDNTTVASVYVRTAAGTGNRSSGATADVNNNSILTGSFYFIASA